MSCVWCGCIWLCFWHKSVHQISWAINSCSASCRDSLEPTSSEIGLLDSERNHLYIDFWGKKSNTSPKKGPPTNHHQHLENLNKQMLRTKPNPLKRAAETIHCDGTRTGGSVIFTCLTRPCLGVNVFTWEAVVSLGKLIRIYREKTWIEPFVCVCVSIFILEV